MTEKRIKPRQVLVLIIVFLVILLIVHRNGKKFCQGPAYLQEMYANQQNEILPKIYCIMPTFTRPEQKAELTRLSHIFMLVPNLYWVLVEDSETTTPLVTNLLKRAGLTDRSVQLNIKTPVAFKLKKDDPYWKKPRGVEQRNLALSWLHKNTNPNKHSIVFFMDDDNTYSIELFAEMSKINKGKVGVWPVGLVGGQLVEKPLLDEKTKQVIGFNAVWQPRRPFPIDMAGFAISMDLFYKYPKAIFSFEVERGYQESEILRHLTTPAELQPLANNCQEVLVWHTRTQKTELPSEEMLKKKGKRSDDGMEV